jgi:hypothetical protein
MATRTCGKHLLAFERDSDTLEHILKSLLENVTEERSSKENVQGLIREEDNLSDEEMLEFEYE